MALSDDLNSAVTQIFQSQWDKRDGAKIPQPEDLQLGNDSVQLTGTVLYADLAESTALVNDQVDTTAAEVYKTYLHCASKIIKDEGGEITAFDGDRVMGVFIGTRKNTSAASCALKINHAVLKIINPALEKQYPSLDYVVKHSVGIDTSALFVARTGVRGANDLVWVGRAANYAAKLCSLRSGNYATWITEDVYNCLHKSVKSVDGKDMWVQHTWNERGIPVYASTWMKKP